MAKPLQQPRPEIVGTVVAPFSPGVVLMGQRDFHPLSANFLLAKHLKSHWTNYAKGKAEAGAKGRCRRLAGGAQYLRRRRRQDWPRATAARTPTARTGSISSRCAASSSAPTGSTVFKSHKEQPDDEITHDFVMDHCVIHGGVNKVVDAILKLRDETGDFGELVYAGMDWVDPALAKRSMQLLAEQVMPRVNAAIGAPKVSAAE